MKANLGKECVHTHTHTHTHTHSGIPGSKALNIPAGLSTPRSTLTATQGVPITSSTPPILLDQQQQLKPLSSIVEAAGLSQVVANLTAGIFSSTGTQLPSNLVTTLAQAGSVGGALPVSASSVSVSPGSSGVSVDSMGSTGVTTNVISVNQNNVSQVQSVPCSSNTLTASSQSS